MISVERHLLSASGVTLELRVAADVDRTDLDSIGGGVQIRPAGDGDHLVTWEWPPAMAPADAVELCTRRVQAVLTAAALEWLGGGAVVDLTGEPHG